MSSPPGTPKRKASDKVSFIQLTNPEVLRTPPRPGGVVPIVPVEIIATEAKPAPLIEGKISREFRIQSAIDETESIISEEVTLPNPLKDAMYLFGISISSIIMMASDHPSMNEDYASWTEKCLKCIRDDFGNHPPNIQGILNHIKYLQDSGKLKKSGENDADSEPPTGKRGVEIEPVNEDETKDSNEDVAETEDIQREDDGIEENDNVEDKTIRTTTKARLSMEA